MTPRPEQILVAAMNQLTATLIVQVPSHTTRIEYSILSSVSRMDAPGSWLRLSSGLGECAIVLNPIFDLSHSARQYE
jgi:hypothetical protein